MNEAAARASEQVMMPSMPDPILHALRRTLSGEATAEERAELTAWMRGELAGAGVEVSGLTGDEPVSDAAFTHVAALLRGALGEDVDVAEGVMVVVDGLLDAPAWGGELRGALAGPVDLADDVFAALDLEAGFGPARGALVDALDAPVDVADGVFDALGEVDDVAFAPVSAALREAVGAPVDLADRVFDALDAEEAAAAAALRDAVSRSVDTWPAVAEGIDTLVAEALADEAAFAPVAASLKGALAQPVDVADAVMAAVAPRLRALPAPIATPAPVRRPAAAPRAMPRWASIWAPAVALAAAAAIVIALLPPSVDPGGEPTPAVFALADNNDVLVEDVQYADGVVGGVISPENAGDVTIIVVDDSALASAGVAPSEGANL